MPSILTVRAPTNRPIDDASPLKRPAVERPAPVVSRAPHRHVAEGRLPPAPGRRASSSLLDRLGKYCRNDASSSDGPADVDRPRDPTRVEARTRPSKFRIGRPRLTAPMRTCCIACAWSSVCNELAGANGVPSCRAASTFDALPSITRRFAPRTPSVPATGSRGCGVVSAFESLVRIAQPCCRSSTSTTTGPGRALSCRCDAEDDRLVLPPQGLNELRARRRLPAGALGRRP